MVNITKDAFLESLKSPTEIPADKNCHICTEPFDLEDHRPVELTCKHIFGRSCFTLWLLEYDKKTCPTCRQVVCRNISYHPKMDQAEVLAEEATSLESQRLNDRSNFIFRLAGARYRLRLLRERSEASVEWPGSDALHPIYDVIRITDNDYENALFEESHAIEHLVSDKHCGHPDVGDNNPLDGHYYASEHEYWRTERIRLAAILCEARDNLIRLYSDEEPTSLSLCIRGFFDDSRAHSDYISAENESTDIYSGMYNTRD